MRNLLWKFVALVSVTGVGFMVVLQVMEGLSDAPDLPSQQAAASDKSQFLEPPAELNLPPLETKETVGLSGLVPSGISTPANSRVEEPTPIAIPPDFPTTELEQPTLAQAPPFPAPVIEEPTPAELPLEFPAPAETPAAAPAEPPVPELGEADLPILVPMGQETAVPNLDVFTAESTPVKPQAAPAVPGPPPTGTAGPIPAPSLGDSNPFTDPVPPPAGNQPAQETAFDPYESLPPLPAPGTPTPAAPKSPIEPVSSEAPAQPAAPVDLAFPAPESTPELAAPSLPPGNEAPSIASPDVPPPTAPTAGQPLFPPVPETPAPADPLDNLPPLAAPETNSAPVSDQPEPASPFSLPPQEPEPAKQESASVPDPFGPPESSEAALPQPAAPVTQSPGRATVRSSVPSEKQPPTPAAPAFPEPQPPVTPPSREIPLAPTPAPVASLAPMPPVEKPSPDMKPLPNITMPVVGGPEMSLPPKGPECAVPVVGQAPPANAPPEPAASPFIDPLDQLTFPNAEPPAANVSEHSKPEKHLIPVGNTSSSPTAPAFPAEPPTAPGPLPEINPRPLNVAGPLPATTPPQPDSNPTELPEEEEAPESVPSLASSGPQQPKLKIEKTAPPKAVLNQPMIYNILVRNVGTTAAHQVVVEDQVPEGTTLTGTIPRGEMANSRLIWRLGVLNPGEEKKIAVRVIPTQEGQVGSVAKVSFVAEVAARTVVSSPKLKLEMSGPGDATLGDALTYHFQIENNGSGDASKVFLRNVLPEGLSHPSGNDLEYEVGLLKAGEKREIDLTVNAAKAGEYSNTAMVVGAGGLKTEASAKVKILGDRLTITRTGPKRRYVGRRASYSNTIVNQSERKVPTIRVVESVPAGMEFVQASAGGQYDPTNRTVTWTIAELGPKANQLLQLELLAKVEGPQASQVTAFDPNGSQAVVKSETTIDGYTALRLDVAEYNDPVDVGEQVGLRLLATNRGTRATTNAVVKLTIPEEMEFVSAKGPVDFKRDGQTLTFNAIPSLDARGEMAFDLVLKSIKPGDARLRLEIGSDQMAKPLLREEGIRILAKRP